MKEHLEQLEENIKIKHERLKGACEAINEYGIDAQIIFPFRTHGELFNDMNNEIRTHDKHVAAEYIAKNLSVFLMNIKNYTEELVRYEIIKAMQSKINNESKLIKEWE